MSINTHLSDIPPPLIDDTPFPKPSLSTNTTISHTSVYGQDQTFSIAKLPPQRHALLTGSRALIKRLGKKDPDEDDTQGSPFCYLLTKPILLENVTIAETDDLSGHIVVCLHREVINVFKFIYSLRSPHIRPEELQDIVLLCSKPPSDRIFNLISHFPKVYFMEVEKRNYCYYM
jgi:hypothetical protein